MSEEQNIEPKQLGLIFFNGILGITAIAQPTTERAVNLLILVIIINVILYFVWRKK